jgi:phytoene dehydrogenase-like protein
MGFVEGETGSCNETVVTCDVDGTEEIDIKVEEAVDVKEEVIIKVEEEIDTIKDEIPEALIFPPIKTEQEVRLLVLCVSWWQLMLLGHLLPQKENCENTFNRFLLCVILWVPNTF